MIARASQRGWSLRQPMPVICSARANNGSPSTTVSNPVTTSISTGGSGAGASKVTTRSVPDPIREDLERAVVDEAQHAPARRAAQAQQ